MLAARQREILAQARAHLAKTQDRDRTSARRAEVIYKQNDDAMIERTAATAS